MLNNKGWNSMLDVFKYTVKSWVKEAVDEAIEARMQNVVTEDKLLTADELCKRWHISKNTLHTREKNGIIKPLDMDGKRKMYSLADVREVEVSGMIKTPMIC